MDITPKGRQRDDEPDIQYVSIGCKCKYKHKDRDEQIRETRGSNVEE
ncbi:unnamed protein product, partial [marine sediment metagenome]